MLARAGRRIRIGDTIIVYVGYNDLRPLVVTPGKELQCKEGRFAHADMVGKQLGTRISGKNNSRDDPRVPQLLLLPVTPELWTKAVPHRTQIIYSTDIAMIVTCLRLVPGSIVAEAGTGSGSLTHSLARAVAPTGMVHTFDFHKVRALEAQAEFKAHGIDHVITSHWADVCTPGFDVRAAQGESVEVPPVASDIASMEAAQVGYCLPRHSVHAVFLDVPAPWAAVPNVLHVLAPNGMVCSFSPCIEQTQRFCEAIRATELFVDVRTVEALAHDYVPVFNTEGERERRAQGAEAGASGDAKRKRDDADVGDREEAAEGAAEGAEAEAMPADADATRPATTATANAKCRNDTRRPLHFRPVHMMKSHTAFLTFARRKLPPAPGATEH